MGAIDWTHIYKNKKYRGKWVAVSDFEKPIVIASKRTLKDTLHEAQKKGVSHPLVTQIPKKVLPIIGHDFSLSSY